MELEFELRRIETEKCTAESYSQRYDSENGTGNAGNNRGERLLESTDQSEQKSKSDVEFNFGNKTGQRNNSRRIGMDCSANQEENVGTGKHDSETTGKSGNDTDRTGWEDERAYAFGYRTDEQFTEYAEEEMDSDILWNDDRSSSVLSNSFYFAGNLFKLINNQTRYHRKRVKLSQKEIEKRLAHGQKTVGYEEYEDYYNNELSM